MQRSFAPEILDRKWRRNEPLDALMNLFESFLMLLARAAGREVREMAS